MSMPLEWLATKRRCTSYNVKSRVYSRLIFSVDKIDNDFFKECYIITFKMLHGCEGLQFGRNLKHLEHLVVVSLEFYHIPCSRYWFSNQRF